MKQKNHLNRLNESTFGYFSENLALLRIVSVCYETDLFVSVVSIKIRNTETNRNILFLFHETNRNKRETDLVSVCFASNRKYFFVCFEDTLVESILIFPISIFKVNRNPVQMLNIFGGLKRHCRNII